MVEFETEVLKVISRTYNVKSFRFARKIEVDFKPGQFFFVTLEIGGVEKTKHFSFSNSPTEKDYIEFTKKITTSEFSQALNGLEVGRWVRLKMPYGSFTFEGEYKKIAFLTGGIGITPVRSICKYIVDKKINTDIILLYGNRTINDIVFKDDFEQMQKTYPALKVIHILSESGSEWRGWTGTIDSRVIKEEISDYTERKFYICGPTLMIAAMKKLLLDKLNVDDKHIITESFPGY
jgi:ferredoxin-NADP reductase